MELQYLNTWTLISAHKCFTLVCNLLCQGIHQGELLDLSVCLSNCRHVVFRYPVHPLTFHWLSKIDVTLIWAPDPTASGIPNPSMQIQLILEVFTLLWTSLPSVCYMLSLFWLYQPKCKTVFSLVSSGHVGYPSPWWILPWEAIAKCLACQQQSPLLSAIPQGDQPATWWRGEYLGPLSHRMGLHFIFIGMNTAPSMFLPFPPVKPQPTPPPRAHWVLGPPAWDPT